MVKLCSVEKSIITDPLIQLTICRCFWFQQLLYIFEIDHVLLKMILIDNCETVHWTQLIWYLLAKNFVHVHSWRSI